MNRQIVKLKNQIVERIGRRARFEPQTYRTGNARHLQSPRYFSTFESDLNRSWSRDVKAPGSSSIEISLGAAETSCADKDCFGSS